MEKRYQVFVSSTYADLSAERHKVIQAIMELDCIPAGMEMFPAADDEQWEFIKRVIDDCDYYVLIIGGRYGSLTSAGISYTEQEYDYAMTKGLKVLAFIHEAPDEIPVGKSDIDPGLRKKLAAFREKVSGNRLVKMWHSSDQLPGMVALSLSKAIKIYPAVGWVRAGASAPSALLLEINDLRKKNDQLAEQVKALESSATPVGLQLASLDDTVEVAIEWRESNRHSSYKESASVTSTWRELFGKIAPDLLDHPADHAMNANLGRALYRKLRGSSRFGVEVDHDDFQTVRTQLQALRLISVSYTKTTKGGMALFWNLTSLGEQLMMELRTVKASSNTGPATLEPPI